MSLLFFPLLHSLTEVRADDQPPPESASAPSVSVTPPLSELGAACEERLAAEDFSGAIEPCRERLILLQRESGPCTESALLQLTNLAGVYFMAQDHPSMLSRSEEARGCALELHGEDSPQHAFSLINHAHYTKTAGDLPGGLELAEQALGILRRQPGGPDLQLATTLTIHALLLQESGEHQRAQPELQEVAELTRSLLGEEDPNHISALNNLGTNQFHQGDYAAALLSFEEVRRLYEQIGAQGTLSYAVTLNNLAKTLGELSQLPEALSVGEAALEAYQATLGPRHSRCVEPLQALSEIHIAMGRYSLASERAEQVLSLLREKEELSPVLLGNALSLLSKISHLQGDQARAEQASLESLRALESYYGSDHPELAVLHSKLGSYAQQGGAYDEALRHFRHALSLQERWLSPDHPQALITKNNLAVLHQRLGDFESAHALFSEIIEQLEGSGSDLEALPLALENLGLNWVLRGEPERGLDFLHQALRWKRARLGPEHLSLAGSLDSLGKVYLKIGALPEAEQALEQALELRREGLHSEHYLVLQSLTHIAQLRAAQGRAEESIRLLKRALRDYQERLGETHPEVVELSMEFAHELARRGAEDEALALLEEALQLEERYLQQHVSISSRELRRAYVRKLIRHSEEILSLHLSLYPSSPEAAQLAVRSLYQRKGRLLETEADTLRSIRAQLDPVSQGLLRDLEQIQRDLEAHYRLRPEEDDQGDWLSKLEPLLEEVRVLQESLAEHSQPFLELLDLPPLEGLTAALPEGALLMEFSTWRPLEEGSALRYAVYLSSREGLISWRDLGEAAPLHEAVEQLRRELLREQRMDFQYMGPRLESAAQQLHQRLLTPLLDDLQDAEQLLISPEGPLALLPFDLLLGAEGRWAGERWQISVLNSGRDLLRLDEQPPSPRSPVLLSGIDFGASVDEDPLGAGQRSTPDKSYPFLEGSRREGRALRALLRKAQLVEGSEAEEAFLKGLEAPSVLHIATHGYFDQPLQEEVSSDALVLHQTGLVLAGANAGGQGGENGFLSAAEFMSLDLRGTELVVLSACETGLGELHKNEGVQGLRAALQVAGSETQVLSLWKVSDEATQILMQEFYTRLIAGVGRGEALRQAKAALREDPRFAHPFYWAAFVLSGDWRPLDSELSRPSLWQRWQARRGERGRG